MVIILCNVLVNMLYSACFFFYFIYACTAVAPRFRAHITPCRGVTLILMEFLPGNDIWRNSHHSASQARTFMADRFNMPYKVDKALFRKSRTASNLAPQRRAARFTSWPPIAPFSTFFACRHCNYMTV